MKNKDDKSEKEKKTKVYFDGDCPMCRTFVPWLDEKDQEDSVTFKNLREEELPKGISKEQATERIHLLDKRGEILTGAKAVFTVMEQNKKLPLLVKFGRLPIIKDIAEVVYLFIANNRFLMFGNLARVFWIKLVICLALIIPLFITRNLWLGDCIYPFTPVFNFLPTLPSFLNLVFYLSIYVLSALIFISKSPKTYILSLLGLLFFLGLFNISRLQPYNYQFFFMFLALMPLKWQEHTNKEQQKRALSIFAIILIGIWFWSGIHKLNLKFFTVGYPWLISVFPQFLKPILAFLGLFATVVETGGAISLLFKKTRKVGVILLTVMHLFLLTTVILHNNNHSIISWNIAQITFLWLVFWNSSLEINLFKKENLIFKLLFLLLPLFSYVNLWNDSLSFKLYSWNYKEGAIHLTRGKEAKNLPPEMTKSLNHYVIPVQKWSYEATNSSPFYSEKVYKSVFKEACKINNNFLLKISQRPTINSIWSTQETYRCNNHEVTTK